MVLTKVSDIGPGGFGIVDKVKDEHGNLFARKTFHINIPKFPSSLVENAKKRFKREIIYQKSIEHHNIVPILYDELDKNPLFYIMPLAICSLDYDIGCERTLNGYFMLALLDIIAGLEELHRLGIYHRDLKPANVLRFKSENYEENDFYAIGDFGLMSLNQTSITTLTNTGMAKGSDYYTAPEIVKELKKATAQTDIFSLGCILHDFVGVKERIPCNEIKEGGLFSGILLNCTRLNPKRRFSSVTALRDALLSLNAGNFVPTSKSSEEIFVLLSKNENALTESNWDQIITFIEDNYDNEDSINLLKKITGLQLIWVVNNYQLLGKRLGLIYAEWIRNNSFNFEECDALANRLNIFIKFCSIEVKAECLMAMLFMGTSHNRFYVERKFVDLVDKNLEENLAGRLSIEFRVDEESSCEALNHLSKSIGFNLSNLHTLLFQTYNEINDEI